MVKKAASKSSSTCNNLGTIVPDKTRSPCPVACSLDFLGDKWSLLIIRDMFWGKKTYNEFLNSMEAIPTNILADRLKRLAEAGIVEKRPYQEKPMRYEYLLTEAGRELGPVLKAIKQWGLSHISGTHTI